MSDHGQIWGKLHEALDPRLRAFFRNRGSSHADVDELTQQVWQQLLATDPRPIRNYDAYAFTVARNVFNRHLRGQGAMRGFIGLDEPEAQERASESMPVDDEIDAETIQSRLRPALEGLSAKCQKVVTLHYRSGLTYAEIGKELDISKDMVKKYIVQALARCRSQLDQGGPPK